MEKKVRGQNAKEKQGKRKKIKIDKDRRTKWSLNVSNQTKTTQESKNILLHLPERKIKQEKKSNTSRHLLMIQNNRNQI